MRSLIIAAAWLFAGVLGSDVDDSSTASGKSCDITTSLAPRLSKNATIVLPESTEYQAFEIRSSSPRVQPIYSAIVEVATEHDIVKTIKYANRCGIPFLAVSGAHGWQSTINNANGGIQISLVKLQDIKLKNHGKTVEVGGGVLQKTLVGTLFQLGKQAVTGLCECVSIIGPLMGGGHSALQGFYGYAADNIVSARVVLASGEAVTASEDENSDLFWALRGAGHNFGVLSSFKVKAYDIPKKNWTVVSVIYTQDKLEQFIDVLNEVDNKGDHVAELVLAGAITQIPTIDPVNAVVAYQLSFLGTAAEVEPYVKPFRDIGPTVLSTEENVEYIDYYTATNNGDDQSACRKDLNIYGYAISLPSYNRTAVRIAYGYFNNFTQDPRYDTSAWLLESYGSRGVWAADADATSLPSEERNLPVLTVPITWWAGNDSADAKKADDFGKLMRATLAAGEHESSSDTHVYLNYATGSESLEQVYGRDGKLQKLQRLKKKYDPTNRFGFYMPLI